MAAAAAGGGAVAGEAGPAAGGAGRRGSHRKHSPRALAAGGEGDAVSVDAAVDAARKQREKQREAALKELAAQERFQDDRMRRCREEVSDAWQDCFFLGTTPSSRGQQRRGPATW